MEVVEPAFRATSVVAEAARPASARMDGTRRQGLDLAMRGLDEEAEATMELRPSTARRRSYHGVVLVAVGGMQGAPRGGPLVASWLEQVQARAGRGTSGPPPRPSRRPFPSRCAPTIGRHLDASPDQRDGRGSCHNGNASPEASCAPWARVGGRKEALCLERLARLRQPRRPRGLPGAPTRSTSRAAETSRSLEWR